MHKCATSKNETIQNWNVQELRRKLDTQTEILQFYS